MSPTDEQDSSAAEQDLMGALAANPYYIEDQPPYLSQLTAHGRAFYHQYKQSAIWTAAGGPATADGRFALLSNRKFSLHRSEKLRLSCSCTKDNECTEEDEFDKVVARYLDAPFGKLSDVLGKLSDVLHTTPTEDDMLARAFAEAETGLNKMEDLQSEYRSEDGHSSELMPGRLNTCRRECRTEDPRWTWHEADESFDVFPANQNSSGEAGMSVSKNSQ